MASKYIIAAVTAIVVIVSIVVWMRSRERKEGFENIDADYLKGVYKKKGIERCDALYADIISRGEMRQDMREKAITPMDNFVLGYRMREWLPSDEKQKTQLDQNKKYCYMLFDSNNGAIDPILKEGSGKCGFDNPLFQNVDFLNNVFVDNNADVPHNIPYTKCVLDIDPERVDANTLSTFWIRMGETQCANYQARANAELNTYLGKYSASNKELREFRSLEPKYTTCMNDQANLRTSLSNLDYMYAFSNCAFNGSMCKPEFRSLNGGASLKMMSDQRNGLQQTIGTRTQTIKDLDIQLAAAQKLTREDDRKYRELLLAVNTASNNYVRCSTTDLPETIRSYDGVIEETRSLTAASNLLAKQYRDCTNNLAAKRSEYDKLTKDINMTRAVFQGSNSQLVSCQSACDYLRQNISTLKDQVQKFATQCNECMSVMVLRKAEYDALTKDVMSLTDERNEWLRRCTYDQKKMLDQSVETINQLRTASTKYTRDNCGNDMADAQEVNNLIQQKYQALAALNAPINCAAREDERAKCCQGRGFQ